MSCFVEDRKDNHIHFLDCTDGDYTYTVEIFKTNYIFNNAFIDGYKTRPTQY